MSLSSLDDQEAQDILNLQQGAAGRGITEAGLQPQIDDIQNTYAQKKLVVSEQIDTATGQYNALVQQDNGICQTYSYDEKNAICTQNLGSNYKLSGASCVAQPVPYVAPANLPAAASVPQPTQEQDVVPVEQSNPPVVQLKAQNQILAPTQTTVEKVAPVGPAASVTQQVSGDSGLLGNVLAATSQPTTTPSQEATPAQRPLTFWEKIVAPFKNFWEMIFK